MNENLGREQYESTPFVITNPPIEALLLRANEQRVQAPDIIDGMSTD